MDYDGAWKLRLSEGERLKTANEEDVSHRKSWPPAYLGNGRLSLLCSLADDRGPNVHRVLLGVDHSPEHTSATRSMAPLKGAGLHAAQNTLESFGASRLLLFRDGGARSTGLAYRLSDAYLSMDTGTLTTVHAVYDTSGSSPVFAGRVTSDTYACRHQPHLVVQSVTVQVATDAHPDASDDLLFHELQAPPGTEQAGRFGTNIVLARGAPQGTYVFAASCPVPVTGVADPSLGGALHCSHSSAYVWETGGADYMGYVRDPLRPGCGINKIRMKGGEQTQDADGNAVRRYRFHVLSVAMSHTSSSSSSPEGESTHALMTIMDGRKAVEATTVAEFAEMRLQAVGRLRTEHVRAWDALWSTNVFPVPKLGISDAEEARVTAVKRCARYALYNVYAGVGGSRSALYAPSAPGARAVTDLLGSAEDLGELWLMPVLAVLQPEAVRVYLDGKCSEEELRRAGQRAMDHGYDGIMFGTSPSEDALSSASNSAVVFWDTATVVPVYKTATLAVNCWNYYRLTRDKEWLTRKGQLLLNGAADFCASALRDDPAQPLKRRRLLESRGFGNTERRQRHNAFAANAAYLALKAAIEASYELKADVPQEWKDALFDSDSVFFPDGVKKDVMRLDDGFVANEDDVRIVEPVLALSSNYKQDAFPSFQAHDAVYSRVLKQTRDYYRGVTKAESQAFPLNIAMFGTAAGLVAQAVSGDDKAAVDAEVQGVYSSLEDFAEAAGEPVWGNLHSMYVSEEDRRLREDVNVLGLNDVVSSAAYLYMLVFGCAGVEVVGGVTNTGFYYESLRLRAQRNRRLPRTWKELRVTRLAQSRLRTGGTNASVVNELLYETPT